MQPNTLQNNKLKYFPADVGTMERLAILWLFDNNLESVPYSLGGLPLLRNLSLGRNKPEPDSLQSFSGM